MYVENDLSTWAEADYDRALAEIESLMHCGIGTPQNERLQVIGSLVERYEEIHWHIPAASNAAKQRFAFGADGEAAIPELVGAS